MSEPKADIARDAADLVRALGRAIPGVAHPIQTKH